MMFPWEQEAPEYADDALDMIPLRLRRDKNNRAPFMERALCLRTGLQCNDPARCIVVGECVRVKVHEHEGPRVTVPALWPSPAGSLPTTAPLDPPPWVAKS